MMKKVFLMMLLAATALMAGACADVSIGKGGKKLKPSSNVVTREYRLKPFDQVDIDVVARVKIEQTTGDDYRVVMQAPENYVELFTFEVSDGELDIDFAKRNVNIEGRHVGIVVYTPQLRKLENAGVADVRCDHLKADRLEVENSGVGSLQMNGLEVRHIEAECSGVGNMELSGTADEAELECSGVGSVKASGLKARAVKAEVSGVGGLDCHATERLRGEVSGVGSLKYGGNPAEKQLHRSGVGKISEL